MKSIQYITMTEVNYGTKEDPVIQQVFNACEIQCADSFFEANYAIAQKEAYNGEITVVELPDTQTEPTQEEDTASMLVDHEFRLTLLELGLNE